MKSEIEKILATHLDYPDVTIVEKLLRPFIYKVVDKRDNQIKDMIDVVLDKWKYEGDYISSNDFKKALTELRSKL